MNKGEWINTKTGKYIQGYWEYNWSADLFLVVIKGRGPFQVTGDSPNWGNWEKVTPETCRGHVGGKYCQWCGQKIDHIAMALNQML